MTDTLVLEDNEHTLQNDAILNESQYWDF